VSFTRRGLIGALLTLTLPAAFAPAQVLNSERIEQTFGSYGIEVIASDTSVRVSNLYSLHAGQKFTRSLAIVGYPERVDAAFSAEHAAILAGGSIGASFQAAGWEVVKTEHQYFDIEAGGAMAVAMQIAEGSPVAAHAYRLSIAQGPQDFDYALIIEIHHPDYLDRAALVAIYGEPVASKLPEATRALLREGFERLQRPDLTLSE